jgi:hypothetical protein
MVPAGLKPGRSVLFRYPPEYFVCIDTRIRCRANLYFASIPTRTFASVPSVTFVSVPSLTLVSVRACRSFLFVA